VLPNLWFYFGREFVTFVYGVGVFPLPNFGLTYEKFKLVSQRKVKSFRCPYNHCKEGSWRSPCRV